MQAHESPGPAPVLCAAADCLPQASLLPGKLHPAAADTSNGLTQKTLFKLRRNSPTSSRCDLVIGWCRRQDRSERQQTESVNRINRCILITNFPGARQFYGYKVHCTLWPPGRHLGRFCWQRPESCTTSGVVNHNHLPKYISLTSTCKTYRGEGELLRVCPLLPAWQVWCRDVRHVSLNRMCWCCLHELHRHLYSVL